MKASIYMPCICIMELTNYKHQWHIPMAPDILVVDKKQFHFFVPGMRADKYRHLACFLLSTNIRLDWCYLLGSGEGSELHFTRMEWFTMLWALIGVRAEKNVEIRLISQREAPGDDVTCARCVCGYYWDSGVILISSQVSVAQVKKNPRKNGWSSPHPNYPPIQIVFFCKPVNGSHCHGQYTQIILNYYNNF